MAKVTINSSAGADFDVFDADTFDVTGVVDVAVTPTRIVVTYDDGFRDVFIGQNFTANGDDVTGGTVARLRSFDGTRLVFDIRDFSIPATTVAGFFDAEDGLGLANAILEDADDIQSGGGDDTLTGFQGDDIINGGDGDDIFLDETGDNQFIGGSGDDTAFYLTSSSQFTIDVQTNALIISSIVDGATNTVTRSVERVVFSDQTLFTSDLLNTIEEPGALGAPTLTGDDDENRLNGTAGVDVVDARGQRDVVKTFGGDDDIDLGSGDDVVLSGTGNDTIRGGDGADVIKASDGDDIIDGGAGDDIILSGNGDDSILGGADDDVIKPGRGADRVDGGDGDDVILGFTEDEFLIGGDGDDLLGGNLGDDVLFGGAGNDRLFGGPGLDTFLYPDADFGQDRIVLDFRPTSDTIDFSGSGLTRDDVELREVVGKVVLDIIGSTSKIVIAADRIGPLTVDGVEDALIF